MNKNPLLFLFFLMIVFSCKKHDWNNFNNFNDTDNNFNSSIRYGKVTDIDGNIYRTVIIGNQTWMAENLKTTRYNDGTPIANVTDNAAWAALRTGAYCWYNKDATTLNETYGALYNWYAVSTNKIAPTGWHVATDTKWITLIDYLGGNIVAGGKLNEVGTIHWIAPNTGATNDVGFTALPASIRFDYGIFSGIGEFAYWWSSTERDIISAFSKALGYYGIGAGRPFSDNESGLSVRCIKN
ncbi:MAG: fibrobacter succinogenes major paralogous domain-containing protein [Prolixibacteraceae bacterium]|nr:fibrobacter succinogenes major paralogous domain-containing protein [Prolixibacteraceae bacterium]